MLLMRRLLIVCIAASLVLVGNVQAAYVVADRVAETTTTTGTGALTLGGALTGFRAFSAVCSTGDTLPYSAWGVDGSGNATGEWETGVGTCGSGTLTRSVITASSNSGSAVSFSAGTKYVTLSPIAYLINVNDALEPAGVLAQAQASLARHAAGIWSPPNNGTTVPGVFGLGAMTVTGTATNRAPAATNGATMVKRLGYVSSSTAGSLAYAYSPSVIANPGDGTNRTSGFFYSQQFVPSDAATVSGARMFVGVRQSTSAPTNVDPAGLTNVIGVAQLATDTTQLYLVYGGSTAQTAIALGTTNFPGQTLSTSAYEITIYSPWNQASVYYVQVKNLANGTTYTNKLSGSSTVVPQTGTLLSPAIWRTNNATALAVGIDIGTLLIQTGI